MGAGRVRRDPESGAAAVEFALLFPLFLVLVFGIINMGFGFNQKINLTQAAREASRYGATLSFAASHQTGGVNDGTIDTWLEKLMTVAKASGGSDLDPSRSGVYVCVAYVSATQTKSLTSGTGGPSPSAPCDDDDGRDDPRVQVVVRSDAVVDFVFLGGKIQIGSDSVTRFEAGPA